MSIRLFIQDTSFDPESVESMSVALAGALEALELTDKKDPLTIVVARQIVDAAKGGERDPERLKAAALTAVRH
jgi:hypothetical protein